MVAGVDRSADKHQVIGRQPLQVLPLDVAHVGAQAVGLQGDRELLVHQPLGGGAVAQGAQSALVASPDDHDPGTLAFGELVKTVDRRAHAGYDLAPAGAKAGAPSRGLVEDGSGLGLLGSP